MDESKDRLVPRYPEALSDISNGIRFREKDVFRKREFSHIESNFKSVLFDLECKIYHHLESMEQYDEILGAAMDLEENLKAQNDVSSKVKLIEEYILERIEKYHFDITLRKAETPEEIELEKKDVEDFLKRARELNLVDTSSY